MEGAATNQVYSQETETRWIWVTRQRTYIKVLDATLHNDNYNKEK